MSKVMNSIVAVPLGMVKQNLDICLPAFGIDSTTKGSSTDFYVLVCMTNLVLSLYPMLCYFSISQNKHVVLWMGNELQHVNLLVPGILFCMSLALPFFKQVRASLGLTRVSLLMLFLVAGSLLVGSGIHVSRASQEVSYDLIYACGSSAMTERVQSEWQRLSEFHAACMEEQDVKHMIIEDCPGFAQQMIAPHLTYVQYIRAMELEFGCSGFCHFWSRPLFNSLGETGRRCASEVGGEMNKVGKIVGIPTIFIGFVVIAVGVIIANADRIV